jgi:hypothetical protein
MIRDGLASSSLSKKSNSMWDALLEKTLKFTPVGYTTAPSGELMPRPIEAFTLV